MSLGIFPFIKKLRNGINEHPSKVTITPMILYIFA